MQFRLLEQTTDKRQKKEKRSVHIQFVNEHCPESMKSERMEEKLPIMWFLDYIM